LACDGWTDVSGWAHIQYFALGGNSHRPIFLRSEKIPGERHTGEYIADRIGALIAEECGPADKVDGVIMDNAAACRKAAKILLQRFPHLTTYGCGAHAANLLAQDVCKIAFVADILAKSQVIAKFFKYQQMPKAILQRLTGQVGQPLGTLLWVKTRWSTAYKMVKRLSEIQGSIAKAVLEEDIKREIDAKKGPEVRANVLQDPLFWTNVNKV
jgi:hypothetical protein